MPREFPNKWLCSGTTATVSRQTRLELACARVLAPRTPARPTWHPNVGLVLRCLRGCSLPGNNAEPSVPMVRAGGPHLHCVCCYMGRRCGSGYSLGATCVAAAAVRYTLCRRFLGRNASCQVAAGALWCPTQPRGHVCKPAGASEGHLRAATVSARLQDRRHVGLVPTWQRVTFLVVPSPRGSGFPPARQTLPSQGAVFGSLQTARRARFECEAKCLPNLRLTKSEGERSSLLSLGSRSDGLAVSALLECVHLDGIKSTLEIAFRQ